MAKYTIELYSLMDLGYELNLDAYPIFDEDYRDGLNEKIVNHYYFREIGQETPDRFNFMLGRTMNEIMPYYNQLYKSERDAFDYLTTTNIAESKNENMAETENVDANGHIQSTGVSASTSDTNGEGFTNDNLSNVNHRTGNDNLSDTFFDTPNGQLDNTNYATTKDSKIDNYSEDNSSDQQRDTNSKTKSTTDMDTSSSNDTSSANVSERDRDYNKTNNDSKVGYEGISPDVLLANHRKNMLNIDMMIIKDLEPLFMQIY